MSFYDMSGLGGLAISQGPAYFTGMRPWFFIDGQTHNSTVLKVNGMTEDIFISTSFWSKNFLYPVIRLSFFHDLIKVMTNFYSHLKRRFDLHKGFVYNT